MAKKRNRSKARRTSRIAQHRPAVGRKKLLQPPLRQLPLEDIRWLQARLPNFLWLGGLVSDEPDQGVLRAAAVLDTMTDVLAQNGVAIGPKGILLDGGLLAFQAVPADLRETISDRLREAGLAEVACSEGFAHAIRMYPGAPGEWLSNIGAGADFHIDPEAAERYLAPVVASMFGGQSPASTAVKAVVLRQWIMSETLHMPGEMLEELANYPKALGDERRRVESMIRASYGALHGAQEGEEAPPSLDWPKRFWRSNWNLYPCRASGRDAASAVPEPPEHPEAEELSRRLGEMWNEFLTIANTTDPDLFQPDRHEVLTGLTAHGLRVAVATAIHPGLWIGEFSGPMLRCLAEIVIVVAWLRQRPPHDDPGIYARFKDFGRGRLKLLKLHTEDFVDAHSETDLFREVIEQLDEEVNEESFEEFQDISVEGNFAGLDLRRMARDAGLEWAYRLSYAPMSSATHSEWPVLARYAMQRCANPLHRLHWLPRVSLVPALVPVGGEAAVAMAEHLLGEYRAAMERDDGTNGSGPPAAMDPVSPDH